MSGNAELVRRIRLGEDSSLELKQMLFAGGKVAGPRRDELADELAAFANARGGTLLLGVDDQTREVLGIPLKALDAAEAWVRQICADSLKPALDAEVYKIELPSRVGDHRPVLRIDVPRSLFVHESPGGYFRRIGSAKRKIAPEMLARLFQERSQSRVIRFDESIVPGTFASDLDPDLGSRFLRSLGETDELGFRKLRLVADGDQGTPRLTLSGTLLATREPQRWLPHAEIQAVAYAGERSGENYQLDARDLDGPLDQQVFEALAFLRRNVSVPATKRTGRVETPRYSERALFEALVNAVAHRDYSMAGARIRLHLFRDRLELYVPGGLPNTLTPESMPLRQYSRNELIVSLLARCPVPDRGTVGRAFLMDRRGDGVPIILEESEKLAGRRPEYEVIDESELRLVIWAASDPGTVVEEQSSVL